MSKKRKNKISKALKTIIPLLGVGAVLAGRGRKNLIPGSNTIDDTVVIPEVGMSIDDQISIGAVMAGRGRKSMPVDPGVVVDPMPMNTGDTGMPGFDFRDMVIQEGGTGISPFAAAKGGRAGYKKGGKVARGCGKIMAGRSKKTKYI